VEVGLGFETQFNGIGTRSIKRRASDWEQANTKVDGL
jgi:hypothetical protein